MFEAEAALDLAHTSDTPRFTENTPIKLSRNQKRQHAQTDPLAIAKTSKDSGNHLNVMAPTDEPSSAMSPHGGPVRFVPVNCPRAG